MRTGLGVAAMLAVAACGRAEENSSTNGAPAPAANVAAPTQPGPTAARAAPAPKPGYRLAADGIEPGIKFGMRQADAIAAATAAFGPGGRLEHNDECGEGPMDFVSFGGLQLGFQDGKLAGWSLSEAEPVLRTKSGLTIGSPRSALGDLEIDEESSLGPEFDEDGVGGTLDLKGERIEALWAGLPCQFR